MLQEFLEIEELKSIHEEKLRLMEREMALSTPLLTELEYIPMLYKWYCELSGCCEESGGLNTDQKGQFLFVILFLYSPIALVGGRIVNGVRDKLAQLFGFTSPSAVSNLCKSINSFYSTYRGYRKNVNQLCDEFMSRLKENGILPQNPIL
ncbi:hypothetical protein ACMSFO_09620 [Bacteroides thetaiotaomicron]|uniref:Transposase n=1 Tax=Bacteroides thetaiotaomicron TaxID=818 RepID=A0AAW4Z0U2_BACT4|nr:hypothetical protein [Bacteroides thetaiotaomicron]MCE9237147.1 hypothetical protein [Bacteroides thetaiotaomicron]MCE9266295.1 hypothetical protein [Bacteroides thetaiotaomicron]MCE9275832.1 hypothetical protein [Bacteroides thetaiotaomicron]MCE9290780.1 hypothetical protein [Bacteroides thetaiotaomicron]